MGFFSKLFGKKQNKELATADLVFYEKVVDKIVVSDTLKTDLKLQLKQAFTNPESFYDDNKDFILSERGLKYPKDARLTPKFVLIDLLYNKGLMAEVDWKEEESGIRTALNEILTAKDFNFSLAYDDLYEEQNTDKIIKLINEKELKPKGYSLVLLDINSDSYVFTIVPLSEKQDVESMFDALK